MGRLHDDEVDIDEEVVRALLVSQLPSSATDPLLRVPSSGTDNAMYRLGTELVVRLPLHEPSVPSLLKEQRWLPLLGPRLPLPVPEVVLAGVPDGRFPFPWTVNRWLVGEEATHAPPSDPDAAAGSLAAFVRAFQATDPTGAPPSFRSESLADRDRWVQRSVRHLADELDTGAVLGAWRDALAAPSWDGPLRWIHADLHAGNLLTRGGALSAVVDFGTIGLGDPALDAMAGWDQALHGARATYRAELGVDDATWARARGWALSAALIALAYYRDTNPGICARARYVIPALLADRD